MTNVLLHSEPVHTSIAGAVAYRIRHRSKDARGNATESTGLVVAPAAAGANRKVLSWAHGTTGIGNAGSPSLVPDPARELNIYFSAEGDQQIDYGIPGLQWFIDNDWVVVATDYQGLGTEGVHHYSVNITNGIDAVEIVKAARELPVGAGTQFGIIGWSQGGGAVAGASELDAEAFGELELVGAVAMSPGVTKFALSSAGIGSSLSAGGPIPPDGHLYMVLAAHASAFPDLVSLDDVLSPLGRDTFLASYDVQPGHHMADTIGRLQKHTGPIIMVNGEKVPHIAQAIMEGSAGKRKPVCPILVQIDKQFDNGPCPWAWQTGYIEAAQEFGGDISVTEYPTADHFALPSQGIGEAQEFLASKFTAAQ